MTDLFAEAARDEPIWPGRGGVAICFGDALRRGLARLT